MTKPIPYRIVSHNFAEFIQQIIDLAAAGFTLNTDIKYYPETFMGQHVAHMDAPDEVELNEPVYTASVHTRPDTAPDGFGDLTFITPSAVAPTPQPARVDLAPNPDETATVEVKNEEVKPVYRAGPGRPRKQR